MDRKKDEPVIISEPMGFTALQEEEDDEDFSLEEEMIEEDNERMDIIGQNGNDGLHYEELKNREPLEENDPTPFDNDSLPTSKGGVKIR